MIYSTPKYQAHAAAPIYKMKPKRVEKASKNHGTLSVKLCRFLDLKRTLVKDSKTFPRTQTQRLHYSFTILHREMDEAFIPSHANVFCILISPHSPHSGSCSSATSLASSCRSYSVQCFMLPQHAPFLEHQ
jgi:hypothetical protein